jgi:hypothetical protein
MAMTNIELIFKHNITHHLNFGVYTMHKNISLLGQLKHINKVLHKARCLSLASSLFIVMITSMIPVISYAQIPVIDGAVLSAVTAANTSITAQLTAVNANLTAAFTYNTVVPIPLSATVSPLAAPDATTLGLITTNTAGVTEASVPGLVASYNRGNPLLEVTACSNGQKGIIPSGTIGNTMMLNCMTVQNLRAYKISHSTQYLLKLALIQTQLGVIAGLPDATAGTLASKQSALIALGQVQTALTSAYRQ